MQSMTICREWRHACRCLSNPLSPAALPACLLAVAVSDTFSLSCSHSLPHNGFTVMIVVSLQRLDAQSPQWELVCAALWWSCCLGFSKGEMHRNFYFFEQQSKVERQRFKTLSSKIRLKPLNSRESHVKMAEEQTENCSNIRKYKKLIGVSVSVPVQTMFRLLWCALKWQIEVVLHQEV